MASYFLAQFPTTFSFCFSSTVVWAFITSHSPPWAQIFTHALPSLRRCWMRTRSVFYDTVIAMHKANTRLNTGHQGRNWKPKGVSAGGAEVMTYTCGRTGVHQCTHPARSHWEGYTTWAAVRANIDRTILAPLIDTRMCYTAVQGHWSPVSTVGLKNVRWFFFDRTMYFGSSHVELISRPRRMGSAHGIIQGGTRRRPALPGSRCHGPFIADSRNSFSPWLQGLHNGEPVRM